MARANVPFLAFNRGLVSPKALARVDLDVGDPGFWSGGLLLLEDLVAQADALAG